VVDQIEEIRAKSLKADGGAEDEEEYEEIGWESIKPGDGGPIITVIHPRRYRKVYRAFESVTG
jgi:hypothetical protein